MPPIETVRVSTEARNRLNTLKRRTGIRQWNILCRWAFCLSLAEPSTPKEVDVSADSNVEMTWRTFTGANFEETMEALLKSRCLRDGLPTDQETLERQFKLHLHRGIAYLATPGKIKSLPDLLALAWEKHD